MTRFVSFRAAAVGGRISQPLLLVGPGPTGGLRQMTPQEVTAAVSGKHLLFGAHGYNTSLQRGTGQLATIEGDLRLGPGATFFGVLWPGDSYVPYINYPFEADDAVECGRALAALCNTRFASAADFSFMGYSLGSRLVLEAVKRLLRKARSLCLAAAAVDQDVLTGQYDAARANAESVAVLSSVRDRVLQLAYPAGDFLSDIFGDADSPFRSALGFKGPKAPYGAGVAHHPIGAGLNCGHADYFPHGNHWQNVAGYFRNCFQGTAQSWPPT